MSKQFLIALGLTALVVVAGIFFLLDKASDSGSLNSNTMESSFNTDVPSGKPTIASKWQWGETSKQTDQSSTLSSDSNELPFTPVSVYEALRAVKVDSDSNIILDHDALISLDEALERIHGQLDSELLDSLLNLIKQSLPGKTGVQTAKIVEDYTLFLGAKEEFSRINEELGDVNEELTMESVENDEALYAELQALREVHLGSGTTNSLFRVSDANARFMFDIMKLEQNSDLMPEEREKRQQEIEARHIEQSINITNWPSRYNAFLQAKRNIINASIGEDEKRRQLTALLTQHFDVDELERIEYLALDQY